MVMIKEKWSGRMPGAARWQTDDAKHHMPSGRPKLYVAWFELCRSIRHYCLVSKASQWHNQGETPEFVCTREVFNG